MSALGLALSMILVGVSAPAKYAGDAACTLCHQSQSQSYLRTSHHLSSQMPSDDSILGSFKEGANTLKIEDPSPADPGSGLYFQMTQKVDGYYETAVTGSGQDLRTRSERIDLVIGSGRRGQSYLYWQGDQLYELPVTYWTDGSQWINSPGFRNGTAEFARPIYPRCLECHITYMEPRFSDPPTNRYIKASLITGISCEICHGPGQAHIARYQSVASTKPSAQAILNPAKFTRDRQVDLCGLCHNGAQQEEVAPAFSYLPGKSLNDYFMPNPMDTVASPDVHGNQVGLLKRSRCYLSSPSLTCSTCHNVHEADHPAASYSNRCLACHSIKSCEMSKTMGSQIANNCIDCHMPVEATKVIVSDTATKIVRTTMRSHWIKIYR